MSLIALATAKQFLQIAHNAEDAALQILLEGAEAFAARRCGLRLAADLDAILTETVDGEGGVNLWLTQRPILEVLEVADLQDDAEPVEAEAYFFTPSRLRARPGFGWGEGAGRYRVSYRAGYDLASLPADLKACILQLTYRAYVNRGARERDGEGAWTALAAGDLERTLSFLSLRRILA